jgi:hypothetical protein
MRSIGYLILPLVPVNLEGTDFGTLNIREGKGQVRLHAHAVHRERSKPFRRRDVRADDALGCVSRVMCETGEIKTLTN